MLLADDSAVAASEAMSLAPHQGIVAGCEWDAPPPERAPSHLRVRRPIRTGQPNLCQTTNRVGITLDEVVKTSSDSWLAVAC